MSRLMDEAEQQWGRDAVIEELRDMLVKARDAGDKRTEHDALEQLQMVGADPNV